MTFTLSPTEKELIEVSREIGGIHESNCHWFGGLARLVDESGKTVESLTVGELMQLIQRRDETYNRIYKGMDCG